MLAAGRLFEQTLRRCGTWLPLRETKYSQRSGAFTATTFTFKMDDK